MEKDSALCWPFVTWADLDAWDELALLDEEHSSKEWVALLLDLLKAHGLADAQGNPVELKPPAVTSSSALFDEDDEVSRLGDEMETDQAEFPPKLSKCFFADSDSVSATPSTYRRWNTLAPQVEVASLENAPSDAAWYGPVNLLTTSLVSIKVSMLELLRTIPLALANLDKKLQDSLRSLPRLLFPCASSTNALTVLMMWLLVIRRVLLVFGSRRRAITY
jgi:hypothetical protein